MDSQRLDDEEIEQPGLGWVSLVKQELLTLPEHLSAPPVFSGFYSFLCRVCPFSFVLSVLQFMSSDYSFGIFKFLAIVLSVLRFTSSDYSFGIFKQYYSYIMTQFYW